MSLPAATPQHRTSAAIVGRVATCGVTLVGLALSIYALWGWMTLSDIRRYCEEKKLDYYEVTTGMMSDTNTTYTAKSDSTEPKMEMQVSRKTKEPIMQWVIPIMWVSGDENSRYTFTGGMLEPFVILSENTANSLFSFGFGYCVSVLILLVEYLKQNSPSTSRILMRPIAGGLAALIAHLLLVSGGAVLWRKTTGVSELSLGVVSILAALFCEDLHRHARAWYKSPRRRKS